MSSENKDEQTRDKVLQPKTISRELPIVCVETSTLHVLQGTTADPGLIYHWVFPRRLTNTTRWPVVHVALSRVRRLKNLRSIGLSWDLRNVMENGPPDSLRAQFHKLVNEKQDQSALDAEETMVPLGWAESR